MTTKNKRLFQNGYLTIKKCRHGLFAYNINDTFIGRSLDLYGEWCEPEMTTLGSLLEPRDIVIDVGAYIGTHSVFFAQKVSQGGLVYAVEPQRPSFNLLCANVELNNLTNVVCINKIATNEHKIINIPLLDPNSPQNFGALRISRFENGYPTESITLDDLKLGRCRLIKIDIEESEEKVIAGAIKLIKKCKPILYLENNTVERSEKIIKTVDRLGYRAFWHIFNYYNPHNFFKEKNNIFAQFQPEANLLCFPKKAKLNLTGFVEVKGLDDNWKKALDRILI